MSEKVSMMPMKYLSHFKSSDFARNFISLLQRSGSEEYRSAMTYIENAVMQHEKSLVRGVAQFNKCDLAAQVIGFYIFPTRF